MTATIERRDDTAILHVGGELDLSTVDALRDSLWTAIRDGAAVVVIDLLSVKFLGSAALAAIAEAREAASNGTSIRLVAGPSSARLFELTALDSVFDIFSTVDSAASA